MTLNDELFNAARHGSSDKIRALIDSGADVNYKNKDGATPLHEATERGNLEIISLFIEAGSDVNCKTGYGITPLHVAAVGRTEACKLLIDAGADVNCKDYNGETPLDLTVQYQYVEICKILIGAGANVNDGWLPLFCATGKRSDFCKILIDAGADVNYKTKSGWTPLHEAADVRCVKASKILIAAGADVNSKDKDGRTPASIAISNGGEIAQLFSLKERDILSECTAKARSPSSKSIAL